MSAQILHLNRPRTVDEAWRRYCDLVTERNERSLWADLEHNMRIVKAWDLWAKMYLESLKTA